MNASRNIWLAILLSMALAALITAPWHKNLFVIFVVGAVAIFIAIVAFQNRLGETARHSFEVSAALISSFAILSTGYWFVFERPGVPKIDLASSSDIYPLPGKKALIRIRIEAKNVGSTAVEFDQNASGYVHVGRILPLLPETASDESGRDDALENGRIDVADNWPLLAKTEVDLETMIEAGESERFYYKSIVPCWKNMVLSVTVRIPKRRNFFDRTFGEASVPYYWIDQSTARLDRPCI